MFLSSPLSPIFLFLFFFFFALVGIGEGGEIRREKKEEKKEKVKGNCCCSNTDSSASNHFFFFFCKIPARSVFLILFFESSHFHVFHETVLRRLCSSLVSCLLKFLSNSNFFFASSCPKNKKKGNGWTSRAAYCCFSPHHVAHAHDLCVHSYCRPQRLAAAPVRLLLLCSRPSLLMHSAE